MSQTALPAEALASFERALAARFVVNHAVPAAAAMEEAMEEVEPEEATAYLAGLPDSAGATYLQTMLPVRSARLLAALDPQTQARMLRHVSAPRAAELLAWLEPDTREAILLQLSGRTARELRDLLAYPPDTAGSLMDPRVITVRETATARDALEALRAATRTLHQVHVVDDAHRLIGVLPIQELALLEPDAPIAPSVDPAPITVPVMTDREELVELLSRSASPTVAVLDTNGVIVGALRHRALVSAAESEALVDLQKMVGASREERALSPVSFAVRKRLPWLQINLATAFLAATVVGLFESTIAKITSLAVLLPVVAGQSGNSGAQALAVTMRGIALREVRSAHFLRLATKEVAVGLVNGVAVALVTAAGVYLWSRNLALSGVIATAMVISMAIAGLAGAAIPLVLKTLGQDPAQSSSIILTTVTDIVGFLSFLGLAALMANALV